MPGAKSTASGVLVVDKPEGPTSHDVVQTIRRALRTSRVGHAGTLDPMATGVLVVCVGEGTKLSPYLTQQTKVYRATIKLGVETDTLDRLGEVTREVPLSDPLRRELERGEAGPRLLLALEAERTRVEQVPPDVSAIHIDGVRAHERVRRGEAVSLAPRPVSVLRVDLLDCSGLEIHVEVEASKGYYVRSLARDLARGLGTVGHLTSLRRLSSGVFSVKDAVSLLDAGRTPLLSVAQAARRVFPSATLDDGEARAARQGKRIAIADRRGLEAWFDDAGVLIAIAEVGEDGVGRVLRGFAP